jgi:hypothetical protein
MYRPEGFGYQSHKCNVISRGCQKLKADPVCGLRGAHLLCELANTNVPSS